MEKNKFFETSEMMKSTDYKERFKAEYIQLKYRYEALKNMLTKWDNDELNFIPTCPIEMYDFQIKAMDDYLKTLVIRAKIENIDLDA